MELGRLYDEWAPRLLAYMMTITRDRTRAEDALQNLFVKLAASRPDLRAPAVYLFRAARNEAIRAARHRPEGSLVDIDLFVSRDGAGEDAVVIADALDRLPPEQREALVLHAFEGLAFREIGEVLGIPQDTAASRYRYALERLREILEP